MFSYKVHLERAHVVFASQTLYLLMHTPNAKLKRAKNLESFYPLHVTYLVKDQHLKGERNDFLEFVLALTKF